MQPPGTVFQHPSLFTGGRLYDRTGAGFFLHREALHRIAVISVMHQTRITAVNLPD